MSLEKKLKHNIKTFDELVGLMEDIDEKYMGDEESIPNNKIHVYAKESDEFGNIQWVKLETVLEELGKIADKIRSLFNEYYRGSGCNPLFYECEQEILELLVDNSKEKEK